MTYNPGTLKTMPFRAESSLCSLTDNYFDGSGNASINDGCLNQQQFDSTVGAFRQAVRSFGAVVL